MEKSRALTAGAAIFLVLVFILYHNILSVEKMPSNSKYARVAVIGIDGMDPQIAGKLMSEGRMPNFKRLSESGSFLKLGTSYPPNSPVAWTSIATGRNPGKHGIFDFIVRDTKDYTPILSLYRETQGFSGTEYGTYVSAEQFWKTTSGRGVPTTVIRWPVTFPPDEVKGSMLSGLGVPDVRGFLSGYSYYTSQPAEASSKGSNRVVQVDVKDGVVESFIGGPLVSGFGGVEESKAPIKVKLAGDSKAQVTVDGRSYDVLLNRWSGWMRVGFQAGLFKRVYGTFKVLLTGTKPFGMYATAVQIDPQEPVADISYPRDYSAKLASEIGSYYTLGMPEETDGYVDGRLDAAAFLAQVADVDSERDRMFWLEFDKFMEGDGGVFAFVYDGSDRVQHVFWDQKELEPSGGGLRVNDAVADYYVKKDKFIGEVLSKLDGRTLLLVVSDHGFTSFERSVCVNDWLARNGYLKLTGEVGGKDDGALFKYVDWKNTKAYSVGFNSVYVNLRGREGGGVVEPADREEVVGEIIAGLQNLTDEKTGRRVVNRAYRREEIYRGPHVEDAPDIVVGFNPGYRMAWQNAVGGFAGEILSDNERKWDGDHLVDPKYVPGVLFSNVKLSKSEASQTDVAATVLDAVGIKIPDDMDGVSLL